VRGVSLADAAAVLLAAPLCTSVVANGWTLFWESEAPSPLPPWLHRLLLVAEFAVVIVLLFPSGVRLQFTLAAVMYLALATGAGVLLTRRGAVPCGCWGRSGQVLSWRLVAANVVLALVAVSQEFGRRSIGAGGAALVTVSLFALCFLLAVVLPEMRHALAGAKQRADGERRWFRGFPDLERP
jgi:hypothetical protein